MAQRQIVIDYSVPVRMRDGVTLWADVYRPAEPGRYPALLARTPYNRQNPTVAVGQLDISRAAKAGYAVVIQDVRGRWDSEGEFYTFANEINDGYDTVEWVAAQAWCSGRVGMFGASYVGATQWLAAIARPPHLSVIMPTVTGSNYHENWTYQGGAFNLGFNLSWTLNQLQTEALARNRSRLPYFGSLWEANFNAIDGLDEQLAHLPLHEVPGLTRPNLIQYYFDWLKHPNDDDYWHQWCIEDHYSNIEAPSFNIGGWYDIFLGGTLRNYTESRRLGGSERVRSGTRLIVGPWVHGSSIGNSTGDYNFGIRSEWPNVDVDGLRLRWLDRWLKDDPTSSDEEPPVKIFVMGLNRWRDEDDWPPADVTYVPYYLHQEEGLSPEKPGGDDTYDAYLYDPRDPVPTRGGGLCCYPTGLPPGTFDQREVEARPDVLVYSTPPLDRDIEVTGPVVVNLWAASSAPDTDFTAKLVDVEPDGFARNLTDGIIRARYRNSRSDPELIEPGRVYEYTIDLWATSNLFKAGHRIRVEISSSNFPRFDRNPNTGAQPGSDARLEPALQRIFHNSQYPSHVLLPELDRG